LVYPPSTPPNNLRQNPLDLSASKPSLLRLLQLEVSYEYYLYPAELRSGISLSLKRMSLLKKSPSDRWVVPNRVKKPKNEALSTRTRVKKGYEGVFQQARMFSVRLRLLPSGNIDKRAFAYQNPSRKQSTVSSPPL
jgi:hypothetical protein